MDKGHSQLVVLLLAGIFAVLLFGREAVGDSLQTIFWIGLVVGVVALIGLALFALVSYFLRGARDFRQQISIDRSEGRPWLYNFVAWPGLIGNFLVFGIAAYSRWIDESCRVFARDCLDTVPYWWVPLALLLLSIPVSAAEQIIKRFRKRAD